MLSGRSIARSGRELIVPPRQTPAQKLSAKLLLGNEWAPITTRMGFINLPLDDSAHEWRVWAQGRPTEGGTGVGVTELNGTLPELFEKLLPLDWSYRWLLLETSNPEWTAIVDNSRGGSNLHAALHMHFPDACGITTVEVEDEPRNIKRFDDEPGRGRWGSRTFTVHDKEGLKRFLSLSNFEPWKFNQNGEPYDFEETSKYEEPKTTDRFTHEMLVEYCRQLGLEPFEDDFYVPTGRAVMIELLGDSRERLGYTLAEARAGYEDLTQRVCQEPVEWKQLHPSGVEYPPYDATFPMTGYKRFAKPTPWDDARTEFEQSLQRYSSHPAEASLSVGLDEHGTLAYPTFEITNPRLSVLVAPTLLEAPAAVREYTAAFISVQYEKFNGMSVYKAFYPNKKQMAVIRKLYKDQGLYPFDQPSDGVYYTLTLDKMVRMTTDLKLTSELVDWENTIAQEGPNEAAAPDRRSHSKAWDIRLHIQENEDAIWNAELDDRCV